MGTRKVKPAQPAPALPHEPQVALDNEDVQLRALQLANAMAIREALAEQLAGAKAHVRHLARKLREAGYDVSNAAYLLRVAKAKRDAAPPPLAPAPPAE